MRIYITGFMGSGKSTVGKQLAGRLNYRFIDLDSLIENETGLLIVDIFAMHGEEFFRNAENLALQKTFYMENIVVSTGGGTPCFNNNMDIINQNGISIYLKLPADALVSRLKQSSRKRPLLAGLSSEDIKNMVNHLLHHRLTFYEKATYIIEGLNIKVNDIMALLINDLSKNQKVWI